MALDVNNIYPAIGELLTPALQAVVPEGLALRVRERYATLGDKYMLPDTTADGRQINACMRKNSFEDIEEELVDATFNALVQILKEAEAGKVSGSTYLILQNIVLAYSQLRHAMLLAGGR